MHWAAPTNDGVVCAQTQACFLEARQIEFHEIPPVSKLKCNDACRRLARTVRKLRTGWVECANVYVSCKVICLIDITTMEWCTSGALIRQSC
jgi:hypothetical protein